MGATDHNMFHSPMSSEDHHDGYVCCRRPTCRRLIICLSVVVLAGGNFAGNFAKVRVVSTVASISDILQNRTVPHEDSSLVYNKNYGSTVAEKDRIIWHQLFIHVGPQKTATTTIQQESFIMNHEGILAQDQFLYTGRFTGGISKQRKAKMKKPILNRDEYRGFAKTLFDSKCLVQYSKWKQQHPVRESEGHATRDGIMTNNPPKCVKLFKETWNRIKNKNMSVFMSSEAWSNRSKMQFLCYRHNETRSMYMPLWEDFLLHPEADKSEASTHHRWNVTIVIGYRHYGEWLISSAKQFNYNQVFRRNNRNGWPNDPGNEHVAPFHPWELLRTWTSQINDRGVDKGSHYTEMSEAAWKSLGFRTARVNVHSTEDVMEQLYCHIMPTVNGCRYIQQQSVKNIQNQRTEHHGVEYDNIVFRAAERNLIDIQLQKTTNRGRMATLFRKTMIEHNKDFVDLPLLCPTNASLEAILQESLAKERAVFGSNVDPDHERGFRQLFFAEHAACQVDVDRLFEGKSNWSEVLTSLERVDRNFWTIPENGIREDQLGRRLDNASYPPL